MKNLRPLKKSSTAQRFVEDSFLIILKRYIFVQIMFAQFIFVVVQYILVTSKAFVLGKEKSSLQTECKMINQCNSLSLPMETIQTRLILN